MHPEEIPTDSLRAGQVGYIACNMKESSEGEWNHSSRSNISSMSR